MYCSRCGSPNPDDAKFCTRCGQAVAPAAQPPLSPQVQPPLSPQVQPPSYVPSGVPTGQSSPPTAAPGSGPHPKKRRAAIIWACAAVLLLALIPTGIFLYKNTQYRQAIALMDAGEYAQARDALQKQGGYRDAAEKADECQNALDYQAAADLMMAGKLAEAKAAFDALGSYEDSGSLSRECGNRIDYAAAKAMMESGQFDAAATLFDKLGPYEDSVVLAQECRLSIRYEQARAFMDQGHYQDALALFEKLGKFRDAAALADTCTDHIVYAKAKDAFDSGKYYSAYVLFRDLGDFEDAASLAQACLLPYPNSGELYRNPDYAKKSCSITMVAPADGNATVLKFCKPSGTVVSVVFIAPGKKAKIRLPEGEYILKMGYGPNWFGPNDLFGDEGLYYLCVFENGKTTTTYNSSYLYTLTIRSSDGNVSSNNIGRGGF